jgi:heme exporter protein C
MKFIYQTWWKVLASILILYSIIAGYLIPVPALPLLHETIRVTFFHVPMWLAMFAVFFISVIFSIRYLYTGKEEHDLVAVECVNTGMIFFVLGIVSGMLWAYITWGEAWSNDPKQNSAAITFLIYCAYLVLRGSIDDEQKRAKISSVFNIFAFPIMIVLVIILPRMTDSLHPGNGGNPAFSDMTDPNIRLVLRPAFAGWILMAIWIASIRYRLRILDRNRLLR